MAQKRMLNKSISLSSQVNQLSLRSKLIFTWAIPHLDDYGLIENNVKVLKATICPMASEITNKDIKEFISKAISSGLIKEYEDCLEFLGFGNHQSISEEKRAKSKFPKIPKNPQENIGENKNPQKSPVQEKIREDKIREDKGREDKGIAPEAVADHSKIDTNHIIYEFRFLNPSYERIFPNKSERAAIERMAAKMGFEKLDEVVMALPQVVTRKYAPRITKPTQLENKLGELMLFIKQEKSGVEKNKSKVGIIQ